MACHLRDFEDKILLHQFLKSESTNGLSIYPSLSIYVVNSDKQERLRIVQLCIVQLEVVPSCTSFSDYVSVSICAHHFQFRVEPALGASSLANQIAS